MKHLMIVTLLVFFGVSVQAQDQASAESGPKMEITEGTYDFGEITQGESVTHIFKFKNSGNEPLVVTNTNTSCGCTVPEYSKTPVQPGETGEIKVIFNSRGKRGKQHKPVTITSNAVNSPTRVTLTGNVSTEKQ